MELSAPTADREPMSPGSDPPRPPAPADRIIGGVAALIARRLGLDPLWVRVSFVLLALAGGIGVVIYGGLWLLLVAGPSRRSRAVRVAGGVVLVGGVPLLLDAGEFEIITGPLAVIILLAGLAMALWQPRQPTRVEPFGAPPDPTARRDFQGERRPTDAPPIEITPAPVPRRSPLGRSVLGLAISVAAIGALIDQANGGRTHPEQWLGAAAVTCGLGLLVAAFVGRGRWLVIPALIFAATGYAGGHIARLGVSADDLFGNPSMYIDDGSSGGVASVATGFGTVHLDVAGAPTSTLRIDARVGIGEVSIDAASDVVVLVESRVREGDVRVNGRVVEGPVRLGPVDGDPVVVVDARVGRGGVEIRTFDPTRLRLSVPPAPPKLDVVPLVPIAEAVGVTDDGWFVLVGGSAVIDADGNVVVGEYFIEQPGVTVIDTPAGEFRLLPGRQLLTPWGELLDLDEIRTSLGERQSATTTSPTIAPTTEATP